MARICTHCGDIELAQGIQNGGRCMRCGGVLKEAN